MTDVAVEAQEPAVPPPPPPPVVGVNVQLPQVPARSAGPERPQGSPSVSQEPARAQGKGVNWRLVGLLIGIPLLLVVGCGVAFGGMSGDGGTKSSTSTTLEGAPDELAEVSPNVWYPEYTDTARELIGPTREARLVVAKKVKEIVDTRQEVRDLNGKVVSVQLATPCDLWMNKDVYITLTFQVRWTVEAPVPVFLCSRDAIGAYVPPVQAAPTTVPAGPGGTAPPLGSAAAPGKPAGE